MTNTMIEGKPVRTSDQFSQMLEEALRRRPTQVIHIVRLDQVVEGLIRMRQEWETAGEGKPLVDLTASVGLMLADFVEILGLPEEEVDRVLGPDLAADRSYFLATVNPDRPE